MSLRSPAAAVLVRAKLGHLTLELWPFRPTLAAQPPSSSHPPVATAVGVLAELHISDIESEGDSDGPPPPTPGRPTRNNRVRYICAGCGNESVQSQHASRLATEQHSSCRPDLWHVLFECTCRAFVEFRNGLHASCADLIQRVVSRAQKLQAQTPSIAVLQEMLSIQRDGSQLRLSDTDVGRMVLFRMLVGLTWTATYAATSPVADPWTPLATTLGVVFDTVVNRPGRRRALVDAWGNWSTRQLLTLAAVYRSSPFVFSA